MKTVITNNITRCLLLWVFIITVFSQSLYSQSVSLPVKTLPYEYHFNEIKLPNGTPVIDVLDLVEDRNGFVWMASRHGLLRYDGHDFKFFRHSLKNENLLSVNYLWTVCLMNDTILCAGGFGGMSILNLRTYRFTNYTSRDGTCPMEAILNFCREDKENVWVAGNRGLYLLNIKTGVFTDSKLKVPKHPDFKSSNPNQIKSIAQHPIDKNLLLVGSINGLISYDKKNRKTHKFYPNDAIFKNNKYALNEIGNMVRDGQHMWCFGWYTGVNRFDLVAEKWDNYEFPRFRNKNQPLGVISLLNKNDTEMWVTHRDDETNKGLGIFDKNTKSVRFLKETLPGTLSNLPTTYPRVYMLKDSILWLTYAGGKGLFRQNRNVKRFKSLDIPFEHMWVSSFYFDKAESTYYFGLSVDSKGIASWNADTQKWKLIRPEGNLLKLTRGYNPDFSVNKMFKDSKGVIWVATALNNLWYMDNKDKMLKMFLLPNDKPLDITSPIFDIFEDSKKQLWLGTRAEGVFCLNPERTVAVNYTHDENDSTSIIDGYSFNTFMEDNYGRIWIGNRSGLCIHDPVTKTFSQNFLNQLRKEGFSNSFVYSIAKDTLGRMWMTMVDQGLVRVTENPKNKFSFKIYQTENGLKNLVTTYMIKDKNGCFWIVNDGLLYFNPYTESFMMTDEANGMLSNCGGDDKVFIDDYGNVFTGSQVGVNWLDEVQKQNQSAVKNLFIEQISINGNPIDRISGCNDKVFLKHDQNNLTFGYTAVCFDETHQMRYRYKLEPLEKQWNLPTSQLQARYMQLKPGKYRFVVDVGYKGKWSDKQRFVDVEIKQVFWKTGWFIALIVLLIGAIVIGILRYRLSQLLKLQKLRMKIASDLHDDVGSTLSSISIMSDLLQSQLDNTARSEQMIQEIGTNAHIMLDSMDDIIWSVNPSNDKFQNLALRIREYAIPLFEMKNIGFSIITPEEMNDLSLPMDVRQNIYLIAKEAVNNLVKYSECTQASIKFSHDHNVLKMMVKDNGRGFNIEKINSSRNGLKNMKRRTEQIKGRLDISSETGQGACISFSVKII